LIQKGTKVQTSSIDPVVFQTTEAVTLTNGSTSVQANIKAEEQGIEGNVAAGTITSLINSPSGVQSVTNNTATSTGRNKEPISEYRERIIATVGDTETASGYNIFQQLGLLGYVKSVQYIDNSEDTSGSGLNDHEAEIVVDASPGHNDEIAQVIFENYALGANLVNGNNGVATTGTATLSNGQTFTVPFSTPTEASLYVDASIEVNEEIEIEEIKDSITEYIGGQVSNGSLVFGDLGVGDDVLIGEVEYAIRNIDNVYDVTSLKIGTSSSPTGTSSVTMSAQERARTEPAFINISTTVI
jgi:uncharacterized phage protein gp47/JayE